MPRERPRGPTTSISRITLSCLYNACLLYIHVCYMYMCYMYMCVLYVHVCVCYMYMCEGQRQMLDIVSSFPPPLRLGFFLSATAYARLASLQAFRVSLVANSHVTTAEMGLQMDTGRSDL